MGNDLKKILKKIMGKKFYLVFRYYLHDGLIRRMNERFITNETFIYY